MSMFEKEKPKGSAAYWPLFGFVALLILGGIAYFFSGSIVRFISTETVTLGASNISIFPISFPSEWSFPVRKLLVTFVIFLSFFITLMIGFAAFSGAAEQSEMDISLGQMRKEKEAAKKKRR